MRYKKLHNSKGKKMVMGLIIRIYNVGFGDASLLTWNEDSGETKNILIDFGNAPSLKDEPYYTQTLNDIRRITDEKIDLLICTHQHLDHYGGFYSKIKEFKKFEIKMLFMPYIKPASKKKIRKVRELVHGLVNSKLATEIFSDHFITKDESTSENPDEIDKKWQAITNLVKPTNAYFLHRESKEIPRLIRQLGFKKLKIEILGPEPNTEIYLSSAEDWIKNLISFFYNSSDVDPNAKGLSLDSISAMKTLSFIEVVEKSKPELVKEFIRKNGNISEYADKVINNTSLVLKFNYKVGNKNKFLLFPGDAEFESWQQIFEASKKGQYSISAHFLKVSHHGSHNGTSNIIAKKIFQPDSKNGNIAVISTLSGIYGKENEVPSKEVMEILDRYAKVYSTETKEPGQPILVEY